MSMLRMTPSQDFFARPDSGDHRHLRHVLIAVHPDFQGQGIAQALDDYALASSATATVTC